jgi:hypothetical protein
MFYESQILIKLCYKKYYRNIILKAFCEYVPLDEKKL